MLPSVVEEELPSDEELADAEELPESEELPETEALAETEADEPLGLTELEPEPELPPQAARLRSSAPAIAAERIFVCIDGFSFQYRPENGGDRPQRS